MNKILVALLAFLASSAAQAVTVRGQVNGTALGPAARVGLWTVGPAGASGSELASAPVQGGQFTLSWPDSPPPGRDQFALRPETIGWPGVLGEVRVSAPLPGSAASLFVYTDGNGNGRRDESEPLFDAFAEVQRRPLVIVWGSGSVQVSAGRGFSVDLQSGWNLFTIDLSGAAAVNAYAGEPLNLRVQR